MQAYAGIAISTGGVIESDWKSAYVYCYEYNKMFRLTGIVTVTVTVQPYRHTRIIL